MNLADRLKRIEMCGATSSDIVVLIKEIERLRAKLESYEEKIKVNDDEAFL
jgi:hypothetical protein